MLWELVPQRDGRVLPRSDVAQEFVQSYCVCKSDEQRLLVSCRTSGAGLNALAPAEAARNPMITVLIRFHFLVVGAQEEL